MSTLLQKVAAGLNESQVMDKQSYSEPVDPPELKMYTNYNNPAPLQKGETRYLPPQMLLNSAGGEPLYRVADIAEQQGNPLDQVKAGLNNKYSLSPDLEQNLALNTKNTASAGGFASNNNVQPQAAVQTTGTPSKGLYAPNRTKYDAQNGFNQQAPKQNPWNSELNDLTKMRGMITDKGSDQYKQIQNRINTLLIPNYKSNPALAFTPVKSQVPMAQNTQQNATRPDVTPWGNPTPNQTAAKWSYYKTTANPTYTASPLSAKVDQALKPQPSYQNTALSAKVDQTLGRTPAQQQTQPLQQVATAKPDVTPWGNPNPENKLNGTAVAMAGSNNPGMGLAGKRMLMNKQNSLDLILHLIGRQQELHKQAGALGELGKMVGKGALNTFASTPVLGALGAGTVGGIGNAIFGGPAQGFEPEDRFLRGFGIGALLGGGVGGGIAGGKMLGNFMNKGPVFKTLAGTLGGVGGLGLGATLQDTYYPHKDLYY